jgi:host factor-I protein
MSKSTNNLQDIFLNGARKNRIPVTIHLTNGYQIKGNVTGFDSFTVVLNVVTNNDGKQQMLIYKHAISTITPLKPILFNNASEQTEE